MDCNKNCGSCAGGCGKTLELAPQEIAMLERFGQVAFLPVARSHNGETPIYLEESDYPVEEYSLILQLLEKKGLISLDFDLPLKGFSAERYRPYPLLGSMALTARGQQVLELLQMQGLE